MMTICENEKKMNISSSFLVIVLDELGKREKKTSESVKKIWSEKIGIQNFYSWEKRENEL